MTTGKGIHKSGVQTRSMARQIVKHRDKKQDQQALINKKRKKLKLQSAQGSAPPGYVFLPNGTPELAELCKELTEQYGFEAYQVNAANSMSGAADIGSNKLTFSLRRAGYHFRVEVIEEACDRLNYTLLNGEFLTDADLERRRKDKEIAEVASKHGFVIDIPDSEETPERVSAIIKEIFPRIPQEDVEQIANYAWEKGTQRVGTQKSLDIATRVQLAVGANIRHKYTDYDTLLKAFTWQQARKEVEAETVKKLREWLGEGVQDDNALGASARETILRGNEDSPRVRPSTAMAAGHSTTHHAPTSANEMQIREQGRSFSYPAPLTPHTAAAHAMSRNSSASNSVATPMSGAQPGHRPLPEHVLRTNVTVDQNGDAPTEIIINGQRMRRQTSRPNSNGWNGAHVPATQSVQRPPDQHAQSPLQAAQMPYLQAWQFAQMGSSELASRATASRDHAIPSIESRERDRLTYMPSTDTTQHLIQQGYNQTAQYQNQPSALQSYDEQVRLFYGQAPAPVPAHTHATSYQQQVSHSPFPSYDARPTSSQNVPDRVHGARSVLQPMAQYQPRSNQQNPSTIAPPFDPASYHPQPMSAAQFGTFNQDQQGARMMRNVSQPVHAGPAAIQHVPYNPNTRAHGQPFHSR